MTPADKLAGATAHLLDHINSGRPIGDVAIRATDALAAYRQSQQALGEPERLPPGVSLADVWVLASQMYGTLMADRLEHGPHEGEVFLGQKQQATYAALQKAVEAQKI